MKLLVNGVYRVRVHNPSYIKILSENTNSSILTIYILEKNIYESKPMVVTINAILNMEPKLVCIDDKNMIYTTNDLRHFYPEEFL